MGKSLKEALLIKAEKKGEKTYLSCYAAFQLAKEYDVKPADIGKLCNTENIKFKNCQLGCF